MTTLAVTITEFADDGTAIGRQWLLCCRFHADQLAKMLRASHGRETHLMAPPEACDQLRDAAISL